MRAKTSGAMWHSLVLQETIGRAVGAGICPSP